MGMPMRTWMFIPLSLVAAAAAADDPADAARPRARQMDQPAERAPDAPRRPAGEPAASLGIVTGPVTEELREHADLPEQGGLVITRVEQGGPAAKAGLKINDILLAFDGHDVTSPLDLADMVEAAGKGARVTLGIMRRGKRQEVEVVLGAKRGRAAAGPVRDGPGGEARVPMPGLPPNAGDLLAQALAMAQAEPVGGGGGRSVQVQTSVVNGVAESRAVSRDGEGTVEITSRDGRKTVAIIGRDGSEIHAGPLDEPADFEAVPEEWRDRVHALEKRAAGSLVREVPLGGI